MMLLSRENIIWDSNYNFSWIFELIEKEACLVNNDNECALNKFLNLSMLYGESHLIYDIITKLVEKEGYMLHINEYLC